MTENNTLPVPYASFLSECFLAFEHTLLGCSRLGMKTGVLIENPSAWKHARIGHFEWTLEEVEVHNGSCILVEHPSGRKKICVFSFLAKIRKFKMAAIFGKRNFFLKIAKSTLIRYPLGRKFRQNHSISHG